MGESPDELRADQGASKRRTKSPKAEETGPPSSGEPQRLKAQFLPEKTRPLGPFLRGALSALLFAGLGAFGSRAYFMASDETHDIALAARVERVVKRDLADSLKEMEEARETVQQSRRIAREVEASAQSTEKALREAQTAIRGSRAEIESVRTQLENIAKSVPSIDKRPGSRSFVLHKRFTLERPEGVTINFREAFGVEFAEPPTVVAVPYHLAWRGRSDGGELGVQTQQVTPEFCRLSVIGSRESGVGELHVAFLVIGVPKGGP